MKPQERTHAILYSGLDAETRLIAIAIADCMDKNGNNSWISIETGLPEATGLSEPTIRRRIKAAGPWLMRAVRPGCRRQDWAIDFSRLPAPNPRQADTPVRRNPRQAERGESESTPVSVTPTPVSLIPNPRQAETRSVHDPSKDPSMIHDPPENPAVISGADQEAPFPFDLESIPPVALTYGDEITPPEAEEGWSPMDDPTLYGDTRTKWRDIYNENQEKRRDTRDADGQPVGQTPADSPPVAHGGREPGDGESGGSGVDADEPTPGGERPDSARGGRELQDGPGDQDAIPRQGSTTPGSGTQDSGGDEGGVNVQAETPADTGRPDVRESRRDEGDPGCGGSGFLFSPGAKLPDNPVLPRAGINPQDIDLVYGAWRGYHPRAVGMSKGQGKRIERAIKEVGLDATLTLVEWVHREGSWWAQHKKTSIETIFCWGDSPFAGYERKSTFPSMVEEALSWKPDGQATPPQRVNGVSADWAWSRVLERIRIDGRNTPPEDWWHPNPEVGHAIHEALIEVGRIRTVALSDNFSGPGIERSFKSAFSRIYGAH